MCWLYGWCYLKHYEMALKKMYEEIKHIVIEIHETG